MFQNLITSNAANRIRVGCQKGQVLTLYAFLREIREESYARISDELKQFKIVNERSGRPAHIIFVCVAAIVVLILSLNLYFIMRKEKGNLKMEEIVVGQGPLQLQDIVRVLETSVSYVKVQQNWKQLSNKLGVSNKLQQELEGKLNTGVIQLKNLPREVVKVWQVKNGVKATLKVLHEALVKCDMQNIADAILEEMIASESIKTVTFELHGDVVTLTDLLGNNNSLEVFQKIYTEFKNHSYDQPIQLLKEKALPPSLPKYYIPRTLQYIPSTTLDTNIFKSKFVKNDIFIFKGSNKSDLASLTNNRPIGRSGNQLESVKEQFIVLEYDGDFDRIRNKTTNPVHLIEKKGENYFWIKSNKNSDFIRPFLKVQGKEISEQDMVTRIRTLPFPYGISIADLPGMGKSLLLANLANLVTQQQPNNKIVLFIVLQEFIQADLFGNSSVTTTEALAEYASYNRLSKVVLLEMMKSESNQVYFFLDGYDEVMQDKLDLVDSILNHLKQLKNFKIIVATRLYIREHLESHFDQFSHSILPFDKMSQIDFLTKYWIDQHGAKQGDALTEFAQACLSALEAHPTENEQEIAGNPLHCLILGKVFGQDAKRASDLGTSSRSTIKHILFFDTLIKFKFSRIQGRSSENVYVYAHVLEAFKLLFPEWVSTFRDLLRGNNDVEVHESSLYAIGLIEKGPASRRFIHRSFAEYILAEYIVKNLRNHSICVELLLEIILGNKGNRKIRPYDFLKLNQLIYPEVAFFVEMHISQHKEQKPAATLTLAELSTTAKIDLDDVCKAIQVCSTNDLENTFDYMTEALYPNLKVANQSMHYYFKYLLQAVIDFSNKTTMLKKVLDFTESNFNADMSYHTFTNARLGEFYPLIPNYTPIHAAVKLGKYNFAAHLVHRYGIESIKKLEYLLHLCLCESNYDSDHVIEDKLLIIKMLVGINHGWVNEKDHNGRTPLIQSFVHLKLLKHMVEYHSANINVCSSVHGTVLHNEYNGIHYVERARWAFSSGFVEVNCTDKWQRNALMHTLNSIQYGGTINEGVLELFHDARADFNAQDMEGNSVLHYALKNYGELDFIKKLLDYGADVNHRNKNNKNALHNLMDWERPDEDRLSIIDFLVMINPKWLNEKDNHGCTPLVQYNRDMRLIRRLVEHGADINSHCSNGTILHWYDYYCNFNKNVYSEFVHWALSNGFELINHVDHNNRTPLMLAIKWFESDIGLHDQVLGMFYKAGANFSTEDVQGDSVLYYALKYSDDLGFIEKVIRFGTRFGDVVNQIDTKNQTLAHKLVKSSRFDANHKIKLLRLLETNGFNNFDVVDGYGIKLLDWAEKIRNSDYTLFTYLDERLTNFYCY